MGGARVPAPPAHRQKLALAQGHKRITGRDSWKGHLILGGAFGDVIGPFDAGRIVGAGRLAAEFQHHLPRGLDGLGLVLSLSILTALQSASSSMCFNWGAM